MSERLELKLRILGVAYEYVPASEKQSRRLGRRVIKRLSGYYVLNRNGDRTLLPMTGTDVAYDGEFFYVPKDLADKLRLPLEAAP